MKNLRVGDIIFDTSRGKLGLAVSFNVDEEGYATVRYKEKSSPRKAFEKAIFYNVRLMESFVINDQETIHHLGEIKDVFQLETKFNFAPARDQEKLLIFSSTILTALELPLLILAV